MRIDEIVLTRRENTWWQNLIGSGYGHTKKNRLPKGKDPYHPEYPDKKIDFSNAERIPLENGETMLIVTEGIWHETWLVDKNGKMLAQCGFHNNPNQLIWPVMVAYSAGNRKGESLVRNLCAKKPIVMILTELSPGAEKMFRRVLTSPNGLVAWAFGKPKTKLFMVKTDADLKRLYSMGNDYSPAVCVGMQPYVDEYFSIP